MADPTSSWNELALDEWWTDVNWPPRWAIAPAANPTPRRTSTRPAWQGDSWAAFWRDFRRGFCGNRSKRR